MLEYDLELMVECLQAEVHVCAYLIMEMFQKSIMDEFRIVNKEF